MNSDFNSDKELAALVSEAVVTLTAPGGYPVAVLDRVLRTHELLNELHTTALGPSILLRDSTGHAVCHPIGKRLLAGRMPKESDSLNGCDLVLDDKSVGRRHFEVVYQDGACRIYNLHSTGTFVNGAILPKSEPAYLVSGDEIRAGLSSMIYYALEA